jgi:polysaccharide biosynthesis/export protein
MGPASSMTLAIILVVASLRFVAGQAMPPGVEGCPADYTIGAEDVLDIAVWDNTALTRTVPVRPDGKISLPLIDDVQAAGLTPTALRAALTDSLARFLASPNVSVIVREVHSFKVTVIGQVIKPGRYELGGRATVLDALAIAGGPGEYAARDRMAVLRQRGSSTQRIPFSFNKLLAARPDKSDDDGSVNVCLVPGDIVVVP